MTIFASPTGISLSQISDTSSFATLNLKIRLELYVTVRAWTVEKGTFDFFQNLIITPSGDFKQVSEEF